MNNIKSAITCNILHDNDEDYVLLPPTQRFEFLTKMAIDCDCELILADDYHLQLDFDNKKSYHLGFDRLDQYRVYLFKHYTTSIKKAEIWKSKSGNHHVQIELTKPLTIIQRIVIQASLCSDPIRESLNLARWIGHPESIYSICLFRPVGAEIKIF